MISDDPYSAMQDAVDIVHSSSHPVNKVAATLFTPQFMVSRTNYWPHVIESFFGIATEIGNSSGSIHAEIATIFESAYPTDGASIAITDPPCPNCVKNILEAGIKKIYIDHKGFEKDFFQRRGEEFQNLSLMMCEQAGVGLYKLFRKDRRVETLCSVKEDFIAHEDSPVYVEPIETMSEAIFADVIKKAYDIHKTRKFAVAFLVDDEEHGFCVIARSHVVMGLSYEDPNDLVKIERAQEKYSLLQEPVNRVLMHAARYGLHCVDGYFFASQVPTSREQVNLVGRKIHRITIGNITKCRDTHGIEAMRMLSSAGILRYD